MCFSFYVFTKYSDHISTTWINYGYLIPYWIFLVCTETSSLCYAACGLQWEVESPHSKKQVYYWQLIWVSEEDLKCEIQSHSLLHHGSTEQEMQKELKF